MRHLILHVMDWDGTWFGLGWLRPRPDQRFSGGVVFALLLVTGLLCLVVGPVVYGLLMLLEGLNRPARPEFAPVAGGALAAAVVLNATLQLYSTAVWNRRADELRLSADRDEGRGYDEFE